MRMNDTGFVGHFSQSYDLIAGCLELALFCILFMPLSQDRRELLPSAMEEVELHPL
jgi:hypothetical protein